MKKILSLLTFLFSIPFTHAVTVDWSVAGGAIQASDGSGALQTGLVCLFFVQGDDHGETEALKIQIREAIANGTFQTSSALDSALINPAGGVLPARIFNPDLSIVAGGFFLVIFDGETYETSQNYTISSDSWNVDLDYAEADWGIGSNFGSWQTVPEPGALTLLTLGASLLMLRRKPI